MINHLQVNKIVRILSLSPFMEMIKVSTVRYSSPLGKIIWITLRTREKPQLMHVI